MTVTTFGIVGCGGAAVPVSEALAASASARLGRVYDLDHNLAQDLGERFGASPAASLDELLADPAVDVVYIAAPHDQLHAIAKAVLSAGKHALVEKPMALSVAQADELIAMAAGAGLKLGVFYELRHIQPYSQARALVGADALGRLVGVRVQTLIDKPLAYWERGYSGRSANPWRAQKARAGGGVLLMNTSHQLDAIRYVTGLEVVSVMAQVGTLTAQVEVEDTASAVLVFDNGAVGSLFAMAHAVGAQPGCDERFDIFGTEGQLRLPDPYGDGALQVYLREARVDIPPGVWHTLPSRPVRVFEEAVDAFAGAVQHGEPVPASGHDALQTLSIVLAMYQSAREGRAVTL